MRLSGYDNIKLQLVNSYMEIHIITCSDANSIETLICMGVSLK